MPVPALTCVRLARTQHPRRRRAIVAGVLVLAAAWTLHAALVAGGALSAGGAAHRLADLLYLAVGLVATVLVAARARLVAAERTA